MNKKQLLKYLILCSTVCTISLTSIVMKPIDALADEQYSLELFSQLADKVTKVYYKEAIVGLDIIKDIYSDEMLVENIKEGLKNDKPTNDYLLKQGFNLEKIVEISAFINNFFPSVEEVIENDQTDNITKRLINTVLVNEDGTLNYSDYDEDIKKLGVDLYAMMPDGFKARLGEHFELEDEKRGAMLKIVSEYIYSGHGKGVYNEHNKEYIDLVLEIDDSFISNVNITLGIDLLNSSDKQAIDIFLKSLERTIKEKQLDRVYSDLSSVLKIIDTNFVNESREISMASDLEKVEIEGNIKDHVKEVEEKQLDRAETLKIMFEAVNIEPVEYKGEFTDVDKDNFYADYIGTGKSIGLINGYTDNTFRPTEKVNRSAMLSILSNTVEYINGEIILTDSEVDNLLKDFKYSKDIKIWARPSVAKLVKVGLIDSNYQGEFGTDEIINRDEVLSIVDKAALIKK